MVLSVVGGKEIDLKKVRTVRLSKKPAPLYRKIKKYRLLNQLPNDTDIEMLKKENKPQKKAKSPKLVESPVSEPQEPLEPAKLKKSAKSKKALKLDKSEPESEPEPEPEKPEDTQYDSEKSDSGDKDLNDSIEFIIKEVDHLEYSHRKEILDMILERCGSNLVYESSDGSRIDMTKLPIDTVNQIKNFVTIKLKTIDITDKFDSISNEPAKEVKSVKKEPSVEKTKVDKKEKKKSSVKK